MSRRRKKGRPISGWLVLDKAYDFGSTEAVSKVKWLFQAQKAGHAGTLDPLATGILPIALGEATKTVPYVMDGVKRYRFTARWGSATTTDDAEGEEIARADHRPTADDIDAILTCFVGEIEQIPPKFSAIKVNGARAYDLARDGKDVALKARTITIHELTIVDTPDADHTVFEAVTGKGTYVRALVRDIAKALGTEGHVSSLRRISVGPFTQENAITIDALEAVACNIERDATLLPIDAALAHLPQISIDGPQADRLQRGQATIATPADAKGVRGNDVGVIDPVLASMHGDPIALCRLDGLKLCPVRVFNIER